jgi:hypothetical protein
MSLLDRRKFLSLVPAPIAGLVAARLIPFQPNFSDGVPAQSANQLSIAGPCWLDVCAPFIVEDDERGIHTEIVLTSDTFVGTRGYQDGLDATDYEIYLYDATGRAIGADGVARRLAVPAMNATIISARDLIGAGKRFWGGMRIRLRPRARESMAASDLFSSAFVRWMTEKSFDNVHANPDPLQWQKAEGFYYSMPFPPLDEYVCTFSLFNPNNAISAGEITLFDRSANKLLTKPYELKPYSSLLLSLNGRDFVSDAGEAFRQPATSPATRNQSGLIAVKNDPKSVKSFGYLLIKQLAKPRFSIDHPIHQNLAPAAPEVLPFDANGKFKAKNMLYSPLLFRGKRFGSLTFESRCFLGTGMCAEPAMWLAPFATGADGDVQWNAMTDPKLPAQMTTDQIKQRAIRLATQQSCMLDFRQLSLQENFSGGLFLAVSPDTTHTLMKMEVRVPEWNAHAFTHFRPGLRASRTYQKPKQRGGIATDYITSGARLERRGQTLIFDEVIGILNIDDGGIAGHPTLEVFGVKGLVTRVSLRVIPGFAGRHFLLSDLIPEAQKLGPLTLRLVDDRATLLMSTVHLDFERQDLALDHGSDRFSTLLDYPCITQNQS